MLAGPDRLRGRTGRPPHMIPPPAVGLATADLYAMFDSSPEGLTSAAARERLDRYGSNELAEAQRTPVTLRFLAELTHFFALLLWVASAMAFGGGLPELGWAIVGVILINAVFSFWQEYKAERAIAALRRLLPATSTVIRDGVERHILARDLVPGDLMLLAEGDRVSADTRLIESAGLHINQATLTGESLPVAKTAGPLQQEARTLQGATNTVFAGTTVAMGSGKGVVFATGMATEFGKVAHLTQTMSSGPTRLQQDLDHATRIIAFLAVAVGVLFFGLGILAGTPVVQGFLFAVGVIVALVPEGLLPTLSLALAIGVQRMARRHALVRRLLAVESLGSCSVICTDKTGTLTQNQMTVRMVWADGREWCVSGEGYDPAGKLMSGNEAFELGAHPALERTARAATLANNARLVPPAANQPGWDIVGDPTEGALLVAAGKILHDSPISCTTSPRVYELAFDPVRKRMSTIHREEAGTIAYIKGAPREVLDLCTTMATDRSVAPLTAEQRAGILAANDHFARDGLRVLALAYRPDPCLGPDGLYHADTVERDLTFLGLMAMQDPPRPEVTRAVRVAQRAGIRVIMITGDYGLTAESIARTIGIITVFPSRILTGADLDALPDAQLATVLSDGEVIFARVTPEHKTRIVKVLKSQGQTVAVTGDGVNDAPALKQADIGIAMGRTGTDVAKEAADLILLDDNFATIVAAIEQGRAVYDNVRKFVTYIFASNVAELAPFMAMVFLGIPLPLTVLQILAVDLGTDMLPALALGAEPPEPGVMERPPRPRSQHLLDRFLLAWAFGFLGIIEAVAAMAGFFWVYWSVGWRPGMPMAASGPTYLLATTMALSSIVASQVGNAFAVRSERSSVFELGLWSNSLLPMAIGVEFLMLAALSYVPLLQQVFGTAPLRLHDWAFLAIWPCLILLAEEIRKFLARRRTACARHREVRDAYGHHRVR